MIPVLDNTLATKHLTPNQYSNRDTVNDSKWYSDLNIEIHEIKEEFYHITKKKPRRVDKLMIKA